MIAAIIAVAGVAYWDEQREAQAILTEFADDQAWLADALSMALQTRLVAVEHEAIEGARGMTNGERELPNGLRISKAAEAVLGPPIVDPPSFQFVFPSDGRHLQASIPLTELLKSMNLFERPADGRVLIQPPGRSEVLSAVGTAIPASAIAVGFAGGERSMRLTRQEAAEMGLPARTAIAGFARIDVGALGTWRIAAVASAQGERDREKRAKWRLLLGVALASGLVLAFGSVALRTRTKELELRHALEIQELANERDERLVLADKVATMGALATGIAHEVSTPLGVIVARAEQIVSRARSDERIRHAGKLIVAESERINEVIRGFLTLARGGAPRLEDAEPVALARSAMHLVAHRFTKAGVGLSFDLAGACSSVACDARLFEQVLVNLLLNACDACDPGGHVELSLRRIDDRVAFVVTDDGIGVAPEAAARATEPFFTTKSKGTGLGLAIANEIVKHHHGSLVLRPRRDTRGTQAVVELPTVTSREAS